VIVKMIVEKQMECRLAGETEALGENLLSITKSHMTRPGFEPEPPRWGIGVLSNPSSYVNEDESVNVLISCKS
jgi:hypothetical protein